MHRYNFKIALRNLLKHPGYSFVNIAGLAVGIMVSFMIYLYIDFETSFDEFYPNQKRIFRVAAHYNVGGQEDDYCNVPRPMAPAFKVDYPEVEAFTRMRGVNGLTQHRAILNYDENYVESSQIFVVDSTFFDVFQQPLIEGNPKTCLAQPTSLVLSESLAETIFGDQPAIGQLIKLENRLENFEVTGIFKDLPENTHMPYDALVSWNNYYPPGSNNSWFGRHVYSYVLLDSPEKSQQLIAKFPDFFDKYMAETFEQINGEASLILQPLNSIHLNSSMVWEAYQNGNKATIYIFSAVAFFLLIIAIINYVNLTTARAATRAKEVGVRKAIGAGKTSIAWQFLAESILVATGAFLLALLSGFLLSPIFSELLGFNLNTEFIASGSILRLLLLSLGIGIVSGWYPSLVLSAYKASEVLKGRYVQNVKGAGLRKGLVLIQLTTSVFVIIGTLIVLSQVSYLRDKDLGFNKENVLVAHLRDTSLQRKIKPVINKLNELPQVKNVASSFNLLHNELNHTIVNAEQSDGTYNQLGCQFMIVDKNMFDLLEMQISQGRNFNSNSEADLSNALMVNEAAVKKFGWGSDPIRKKVHFGENPDGEIEYLNTIGVVKDFNLGSLHFGVEPILIFPADLNQSGGPWLFVKLESTNLNLALEEVQKAINDFQPKVPSEYQFMSQDFMGLYAKEQNLIDMLGYFSIVVITLSCLGLLGLVSFTTTQKSKEIAIRKVLGARVPNLVLKVSGSFIVLTIISNILAWPLAFWVMSGWLDNFAYRIEIETLHFILAAAVSLLIVVLTIANHSIRVALASPVKSLKDE
ncbi:MAG: ABC transporter permease [Cyclobacteriaceae bacterium]